MTTNPHPKPTTDLDTAKLDMARYGYCSLKALLTRDDVYTLRTRLSEQIKAEAEIGLTHHMPDKKQLVMFLLNKGQVFRDILLKPALHEVVSSVLGEEYLLSSFHAHIAHPGGERRFHTDQFWMPPPTTRDKRTLIQPGSITRSNNRGHHVGGDELVESGTISPAVVCNSMWMLDDYTTDNGATIVVPGSHLSGRQPDAALDADANWIPAVGPAGSVVIFEGRTWHSTGTNQTEHTRTGLTVNFCAPQFRQQENLLLGTRPEVLEGMSDELKKLCGFVPWQGYGAYENCGEFVKRDEYTVGELHPSAG